jgi:folylpolyglutamate synthase/dihydropteroate synthase
VIKSKELKMHTDEQKKFDIRTIERNIKGGIITQKDYETYLSKLSDVSEKVFTAEEDSEDSEEFESKREAELSSKKKEMKKKVKSKGK